MRQRCGEQKHPTRKWSPAAILIRFRDLLLQLLHGGVVQRCSASSDSPSQKANEWRPAD
jgi:hypothetical protein